MDQYAIIVAGGTGTRMKSKLPKQFIEIGGLPILMHTINQFLSFSQNLQIILVLPENQIDTWQLLCQNYKFDQVKIQIVKGGNTRYQSCKNGIEAIKSVQAIVAIHDGVRPFVSSEIIKKGYELAAEKGSAVCCIESKDSARYFNETFQDSSVLERKRLRLVQTPQIFSLNILKKAYSHPESDTFTDDASVVEAAGYKIELFEGDSKNIKITTADDLLWAELLLKNQNHYNF